MKKNGTPKSSKTVSAEDLVKALKVKSDVRAGIVIGSVSSGGGGGGGCRTCGLGGGNPQG